MESNRNNFPVLWRIEPLQIPGYSIKIPLDSSVKIYGKSDIFDKNFKFNVGVKYDINRVSSRNARKSELGPYKNSFLREIINSHNLGKSSGTKSELVDIILSYHESKSR